MSGQGRDENGLNATDRGFGKALADALEQYEADPASIIVTSHEVVYQPGSGVTVERVEVPTAADATSLPFGDIFGDLVMRDAKPPRAFDVTEEQRAELTRLYAEMADLTLTDCKARCKTHFSCCSPEYCEMALERAQQFGEPLEPTGDPRLPCMGQSGCVAAPHLRPLCTLHHCDINALGIHKTDPGWTDRYFRLRAKIEDAEARRMGLDLG
jgi:hypothetical protein